jgi:hypothetical protein
VDVSEGVHGVALVDPKKHERLEEIAQNRPLWDLGQGLHAHVGLQRVGGHVHEGLLAGTV